MKHSTLLLFFLFFSFLATAQVGINTTTPNAHSALDIQATDAGVLIPRLTQGQRTAMVAVQGMLVYETTANAFFYNDGTQWIELASLASVNRTQQAGSFDVGSTSTGWQYYKIVFATPFTTIPIINLTFREGSGTDNSGSYSAEHIKVAKASTTGFTVGIYDNANTNDVFIDWIATEPTQ
ncbi:hypothetical protein [Marixanthomonas spongiae]|uniref:H-type lectin domain-containing protein n=1 Tax=Marixanthomonas spongiae TaxID=2174845 RepID=A0A2U0I2G3_9FLAO|nr:hypothetical protein [Marixanthomonas spongiae]PVW15293.1 hypothetical protein DDV96_07795 [Marixanthomonas spongiae]